jgi:Galactose oxidase, central domain/Kelch motif
MVLLAGGDNGSVALSSAEVFNPATGTFTLTGSLNAARLVHTATLLNDGTVLLTGGSGPTGILASTELYNPATGIFTAMGSLNIARYVHTATALDNGMILLAGGTNDGSTPLASAELY